MKWEDFESSMTEEELALPSWLQLSDERLGQLVRANCELLKQKDEEWEFKEIMNNSACLLLIAHAEDTNSGSIEITIDVTANATAEKRVWRITVEEVKA